MKSLHHLFQVEYYSFLYISEKSSYVDKVLAHIKPNEEKFEEPTETVTVPLKVNDRIVWITDESPEYGVVKWLGQLPDMSEVVAGIEFVSIIPRVCHFTKSHKALFRKVQNS